MLQEGIYSLLAGSADVQAMLGNPLTRADSTTGIFPFVIEEGCTLPCIVYRQIFGEEMQTLDGRGELRRLRLELSAFAAIASDAKKTAAAVKNTLIAYQGTLSEGTSVDSIHLSNEMDDFEKAPKPAQETGGRSLYRTAVDIEVWYREAD
jgi:Protein of unknown function (DUF3168)